MQSMARTGARGPDVRVTVLDGVVPSAGNAREVWGDRWEGAPMRGTQTTAVGSTGLPGPFRGGPSGRVREAVFQDPSPPSEPGPPSASLPPRSRRSSALSIGGNRRPRGGQSRLLSCAPAGMLLIRGRASTRERGSPNCWTQAVAVSALRRENKATRFLCSWRNAGGVRRI